VVAIPDEIERTIHVFLDAVAEDFPVSAAYVFGSVAKGEATDQSDVDVAVISTAFRGMRRVDVIATLICKTHGAKIDLQPIGFTPEDFEDEEDLLVRAIREQGLPLIQ